jgi:pyridoxal biosynthesis lyase PdxS
VKETSIAYIVLFQTVEADFIDQAEVLLAADEEQSLCDMAFVVDGIIT